MCLCVGIVPMVVFVGIASVPSFVVSGSGSIHPAMCTRFVFVTAVLIAVTDIVAVLGAIMRYL